MISSMPPDLMTTAQAARQHDVTVQTVHNWVAAGRITPVLKLAGTGALLFDPADVDDLGEPTGATK